MNAELGDIAARMVAAGKGILAADESSGTIAKRLEQINVESTETNRRDYREMLFRAGEAMRQYICGVILFDETLRQKAADGTPLVDLISEAGAVPGIKVDTGARPLAGTNGEKVTEGLDGLRERLAEYHDLGARFAKWRAVIEIDDGKPTWGCVKANAHALARYAALCQEAGIVPIVEPEVLMDGPVARHSIEDCRKVTEWTLNTVFDELYEANVALEGMVLKPNMVIAGQNAPVQASAEEVADQTVACLRATVPAAVPGIAFLSGGQSDEQASQHLSLINQVGGTPWALTFSYGRALQQAALKTWLGKPENVPAAQRAFTHRARMNALATEAGWRPELERAA
jgi:fructose-bisphosphate aldolase class I